MDEEAILGGPRLGEGMPDFVYEDFEENSAGGGRMSDAPDRDTPCGRRRFVDDSDDRLFRQVTDDEQSQRARSDRGSFGGFRSGRGRFHQL